MRAAVQRAAPAASLRASIWAATFPSKHDSQSRPARRRFVGLSVISAPPQSLQPVGRIGRGRLRDRGGCFAWYRSRILLRARAVEQAGPQVVCHRRVGVKV